MVTLPPWRSQATAFGWVGGGVDVILVSYTNVMNGLTLNAGGYQNVHELPLLEFTFLAQIVCECRNDREAQHARQTLCIGGGGL